MSFFICEYCQKEFKRKQHYMAHLNRKKKCYDIYNCEKCNRIFSTKQQLQNHKNMIKDCSQRLNITKNIEETLYFKNTIKKLKNEKKNLLDENMQLKKELRIKNEYITNMKLF